MALRLIFAGTPEFAVPSLRACAELGDVCAVYSQPDRPAGRGRQLHASPVKQAAMALGLDVQQPINFKSDEALQTLARFEADLMVVVAYGLILPQAVLDTPRLGCWNVHASLLPRWRGAAPIQRAMQTGDAQTGVCLMQMEKGLDTGPVLLQLQTAIQPEETGGSLHDRLSMLGAEVLSDGLKLVRASLQLAGHVQPEQGVCYAHKIQKAEALLDWHQDAHQLANTIRAFNPWPVAETELHGERVRIYRAQVLPETHTQIPGSILASSKAGIDVACGSGVLRLLSLQRAGGRPLSAAEFLNARPRVL